ncbi:unnamed protein product, partial [Acidithrix sp. C25]
VSKQSDVRLVCGCLWVQVNPLFLRSLFHRSGAYFVALLGKIFKDRMTFHLIRASVYPI